MTVQKDKSNIITINLLKENNAKYSNYIYIQCQIVQPVHIKEKQTLLQVMSRLLMKKTKDKLFNGKV